MCRELLITMTLTLEILLKARFFCPIFPECYVQILLNFVYFIDGCDGKYITTCFFFLKIVVKYT